MVHGQAADLTHGERLLSSTRNKRIKLQGPEEAGPRRNENGILKGVGEELRHELDIRK